MKPAKASLLLHPVFLLSLALLLLNDFYWKYTYGNWFTGKLSDFCGLIVFPVFLKALFPRLSNNAVVIFSTLFFAWWKSPLSTPVIAGFDAFLSISLHRTVDYSDFLAMSVLPIVYFMQPRGYKINLLMKRSMTYLSGLTALFALCATSYIRHLPYNHFEKDEVLLNQELCTERSVEEIFSLLQKKGVSYKEETERYFPLFPQYRLYHRTHENDSINKWVPVAHTVDSPVYVQDYLYRPNYVIAAYSVGEETFKNIRFEVTSVNTKKKKSCITIKSFMSKVGNYELYPNKKQKKVLRRYFADLFGLPPDV